METRLLHETWKSFLRYYANGGFIDRWIGDSINDPNNESKHSMRLNIFTEFYRLNGVGKWIHKSKFKRDFHSVILDASELFSSDEIWNEHLLPETAKAQQSC